MTQEQLQKEVERLKVKLETLVNYLNMNGTFGPPHGREAYDAKVKAALTKAGLQQ
jgi:hypothetical protein